MTITPASQKKKGRKMQGGFKIIDSAKKSAIKHTANYWTRRKKGSRV